MRIWMLLISLLKEARGTSATRRIDPLHGFRLRIWGKEHVHVLHGSANHRSTNLDTNPRKLTRYRRGARGRAKLRVGRKSEDDLGELGVR